MNAKTEMFQNALPLICAGLGDKLNVKIKVQGNQASTDGTTIIIPDFKVTTKEDKDAVLGFASHEAAHIKFNSFDGIKQQDIQGHPLRKSMWNIFEDLRIENAMIKSMIGTRKWIDQIWINRQKEGCRPSVTSKSEPTKILFDYLLFTCRVKYRDQKQLQPYLDAATDAFIDVLGWKLQMDLDNVLSKHLPNLDSSVTALNLAKKVEQLINNHEPEEESNSSESDNDEDEQDKASNSNGGDSSEESQQEDDGQSFNGESESESSTNSTSNSEFSDSYQKAQSSCQSSNTPTADDIKQAIESLAQASDEDFEDDMEQYIAQMAKLAQANDAKSHVSIPEIQYAKYVTNNSPYSISQGKKLTSEVKRDSNLLTAKIQGLVQEDIRIRCKTTNSGQRLNTKVLHRIAAGNSKVFKSKAKKVEVDTIVEVMIDNSFSMCSKRTSNGKTLISEARKAQLSLALALDKLDGVTVTASAFPTAHTGSSQVIELLSEGESVKKLATRLSIVTGQGDNTPSASAMWHSIRKVIESKRQRKIILFVTDGHPNLNEMDTLKSLVSKAEKNGIVVIGIAIGNIALDMHRFYYFFSNAIFIQDAAELKTEMFKVARNLISG